MTRRLLTATAAATLVLGLAACGDKTDGTITDPPATVAVDTSDNGGDQPSDGGGAGASDGGGSTEAAPDIPAPDPADYPGMDEETDEGAQQAFKYYIDTIFWSFQTEETDTLSALASKDCTTCQKFIGEVEDHRSSGLYWSKTELEQVTLSSQELEAFDATVAYGLIAGPHTEPNLDTGEQEDYPESIYSAAGGLNWKKDHWELADVSVKSEAA